MKVLAKDIEVTLHGATYLGDPRHGATYRVDLLLGLYASPKRPCLILAGHPQGELARESEVIAIATTNPPAGYLMGFPFSSFAVKTWTENEGLWEQLSDLADSDGNALFHKVEAKDGSHRKLILGHRVSPIYRLGASALLAYQVLCEELEDGK